MFGRGTQIFDAARGLSYLHNLDPPIVHGNIKPEKVIVQDNLVAALSGFGLSKICAEEHTGLTTSEVTGVLMRDRWSNEPDSRPSTSDLLNRVRFPISVRKGLC